MRLTYPFQRRLLVVMATGLMAASAWADGSITFIHGGIGPVTNLPNANFTINLVNGATTETFVNKTGQVILDVHFSWANNLAVRGYDDLPDGQTPLYFGSYTAAPKTLDFFDQQNGVGIGKDEKFEISISGFGNMAQVAVKLTFAGGKGVTAINQPVPEPEAAVMGLAGLALLMGWRRRAARQRC